MPTPSGDAGDAPPAVSDIHFSRSPHTCPPETDRDIIWRSQSPEDIDSESSASRMDSDRHQQQPTPPAEADTISPVVVRDLDLVQRKPLVKENDGRRFEKLKPLSGTGEIKEQDTQLLPRSTTPAVAPPSYLSTRDDDFSDVRLIPSVSSSFLRPGSKFQGSQQSDRQTYDVLVEIKHVDMDESFLCGFLRIQGLTEDHPTLTTYFEGEIIGNKYTFQTKHPEWGSNERVDMQHWARFPAWRPLAKQAKKPDFNYKNFAQRESIFMRWKEYFLVPDHRVRTISGASFEGFYYICFNQVAGTVSGIYFHAKSEKYQQLELKHVEDYGCMGAMEFR